MVSIPSRARLPAGNKNKLKNKTKNCIVKIYVCFFYQIFIIFGGILNLKHRKYV
jgi:hypothetical protein